MAKGIAECRARFSQAGFLTQLSLHAEVNLSLILKPQNLSM